MKKTNKTIRKVAKNIKQTETIGKDKGSKHSKEVSLVSNLTHAKKIEEVEEREPTTKEKAKSPRKGSVLACILEKFPSEGEFTISEILQLVREGNTDMQNKKDSSLRTVIKELVSEPVPAKASSHINRYACLFSEDGKKFRRI